MSGIKYAGGTSASGLRGAGAVLVGKYCLFYKTYQGIEPFSGSLAWQVLQGVQEMPLSVPTHTMFPLLVSPSVAVTTISFEGYEANLTHFPKVSQIVLTTSQPLYRADEDPIHVVFWGRRLVNRSVKIEIVQSDKVIQTLTLKTGQSGMGFCEIPKLPVGQYSLRMHKNVVVTCDFHVARYDPSLLELVLLDTPELNDFGISGKAAVTSGGRGVVADVTCQLKAGGSIVDDIRIQPDASGEFDWRFRLTNSDAQLSLAVSWMVAGAMRIAEVPIPRSGATERHGALISNLGQSVHMASMPSDQSVRMGSWYVTVADGLDAPIEVVTSMGENARLLVKSAFARAYLMVVNQASGEIVDSYDFVGQDANTDIEIPISYPLCALVMCAWVMKDDGEGAYEYVPWEGVTQLVQIPQNSLTVAIEVPATAQPASTVPITVSTTAASGQAYIQVTDMRMGVPLPGDLYLEKMARSMAAYAVSVGQSWQTQPIRPSRRAVMEKTNFRGSRSLSLEPEEFFLEAQEKTLSAADPVMLAPWQVSRVLNQQMTIYARLVDIVNGQVRVEIPTGDFISQYRVMATVTDNRGQFVSDSQWLSVRKEVYSHVEAPSAVALGQPAQLLITPHSVDDGLVHVIVMLDQETLLDQTVNSGDVISHMLANPGLLQVTTIAVASGYTDRVLIEVKPIGKIVARRPVMQVVPPHTAINVANFPGNVDRFWVVAGAVEPPGLQMISTIRNVMGYRGCIEQSSAVLLTLWMNYTIIPTDVILQLIVAMVARIESMMISKTNSEGFYFYPPIETGRPMRNQHYERLAVAHLQQLGHMLSSTSASGGEVVAISYRIRNLAAYALNSYGWPSVEQELAGHGTSVNVANQLMLSYIKSDPYAQQVSLANVPSLVRDLDDLKAISSSSVLRRQAACYAAIILLMKHDFSRALALANVVFASMDENGIPASSQDTAAVVMLLQALDKAGLCVYGDRNKLSPVIVNGKQMILETAAEVSEVHTLATLDQAVMIGYMDDYTFDLGSRLNGPNPMEISVVKGNVLTQMVDGVFTIRTSVGTRFTLQMKLPGGCPKDGAMARLELPSCIAITVGASAGQKVLNALTDLKMGDTWEVAVQAVTQTTQSGQDAYFLVIPMYGDPRESATSIPVRVVVN